MVAAAVMMMRMQMMCMGVYTQVVVGHADDGTYRHCQLSVTTSLKSLFKAA
jgi:hypothetical protein